MAALWTVLWIEPRRAAPRVAASPEDEPSGERPKCRFSGAVDALNHTSDGARYDSSLQVLACAAALPLHFQEYEGALYDLSRSAQARSLLIAGLASTPACWSLFGRGIDRTKRGLFDGTSDADRSNCNPTRPSLTANVERLSTVLKLHEKLPRTIQGLEQNVSALAGAFEQYKAAMTAPLASSKIANVALPPINLADSESAHVAIAALEDLPLRMDHLAQLRAYQQRIAAAVDLAAASLRFADSVLTASAKLDETVWVGLEQEDRGQLGTLLRDSRSKLEIIQEGVDIVAAVGRRDWAAASTGAFGLVRERSKECKDVPVCKRLDTVLGRFGTVLVAVASENDPDSIAEAIEQAASPPGGWKRKGVEKTFTLSLTAHPGLMTGLEYRFGKSDGANEDSREPHGVAPALTLPLGLEFAWSGTVSPVNPFAVFVSVIDPAAFLQYDASQNGQLPPPSFTTALAPGASVRLGINDTPFSILFPHFVYRPGLRASEADAAAANAFQIGVGFSVDVTLLELAVIPRGRADEGTVAHSN